MVQKQSPKPYSKLRVQANNKLQPENKPAAIKKPSLQLQTHDNKSKKADLKAIKMKKSRPIKKSNVEIDLQTPSATPTKPPPCKSPNYMKSTTSSEARKDNTASKVKFHKVAKTLAKSSSLKKMRTLTKTPSFKHTKSRSMACKKLQRATCSSTLKDSKFPDYLKLKHGATEAEGNSVVKVCSYTYCSLNGHLHHVSAPPLKRFLSSRRRIMKALKLQPQALSPKKAKSSKQFEVEGKEDQNEDFFVEVFVSGTQVDTPVSQTFSDGPCSEIDIHESNLLGMILGSEDEDSESILVQKKLVFESDDEEINGASGVSLEEFFGENSDMEWEEGQSSDEYEVCEIYDQRDYSTSEKLEFPADDYLQHFHDEIVECRDFSDIDQSSDSESSQAGENLTEELVIVTDNTLSKPNELAEHTYQATEATEFAASLEDKSTDKHCTTFSYPLEGTTESQAEELNSYENLVEINVEDSDTEIKEDNSDEFDLGEREADNCVNKRSANSEEANDSSKYVLEDVQMTEETDESSITSNKMELINSISNNGGSDSNMQALEICNKLRISMRGNTADEAIEEGREFNPRGPNFLPIELQQEAEKVDLRHQEMDTRRNSDEWMLDYALQKTVNQLAPARKRKVALLVEAFESVLPIRYTKV